MRVVMLLHKSVEHDARVQREAGALGEAGHEVVLVHLPGPDSGRAAGTGPYELRDATPGATARRLPGPARRAAAAAGIARRARRERPDVVHAHDAAMLPPGWYAASRAGAKLVYDSHELATGVPYRSRFWELLVSRVERSIVPRCDGVITVSEGISHELREMYALDTLPTVVRNVPDLPPPDPDAPDLRASLGIGSAPLVLHQGALAADRGCETLLRAIERLPSAHLLLLGAEGPYSEGLRRLAAELGIAARVHFRPPAPLGELLSQSAQADVGVTLLEPVCKNHRLALPNKLFEYVMAGIPVVASDLPEMGRLVREYGIGWTVDPTDPDSVAEGIGTALHSGSDPELRRRLASAAEVLSWRHERELLLDFYDRLADSPRR